MEFRFAASNQGSNFLQTRYIENKRKGEIIRAIPSLGYARKKTLCTVAV